MTDLTTIPSQLLPKGRHSILLSVEKRQDEIYRPKKILTQHVPALSFWLVRGEGMAHSHAWHHSVPHARPLTSRLTGVGNHSATEKDTVLELVNIFWFVSIFITRWKEDGDVLYIILGHILDQSFGGKQKEEYLDHANKNTENMTTTPNPKSAQC